MPEFKNNSGTMYTKSLFFETSTVDKSSVVYTLKDEDHMGYPSLKRLFFESGDISGYTLATEHLGGWEHLNKLKELSWFMEYWEPWVKEYEVKIRAEALVRLSKESKNSDSRSYVDLNKYLLQKGWELPEERKPLKKRGAPSKADIKEAATTIAKEQEMLASELLRVSGTPLN